jgi:hypothetical protein
LSENTTPSYKQSSTKKTSDEITENPEDQNGDYGTAVDYGGRNGEFMSKDEYSFEDSTYDDDGLYTPVDYKEHTRTSMDTKDNFAMSNAGDTDDDLYTSVDNMEFDMKHGGTGRTSEDRSNVLQSRGEAFGKFSKSDFPKSNGFVDEETEMPVYAVVDKTKISPKVEKKSLPQENEFEIPPPIPDRFFLERDDFKETGNTDKSINSQQNRHDVINNTPVRHEHSFVPLAKGQMNDGNENATKGVVETDIATFPQRLQKFNSESSIGGNNKNGIVQKSKKAKKKSRTKVAVVTDLSIMTSHCAA